MVPANHAQHFTQINRTVYEDDTWSHQLDEHFIWINDDPGRGGEIG